MLQSVYDSYFHSYVPLLMHTQNPRTANTDKSIRAISYSTECTSPVCLQHGNPGHPDYNADPGYNSENITPVASCPKNYQSITIHKTSSEGNTDLHTVIRHLRSVHVQNPDYGRRIVTILPLFALHNIHTP